VHYHIYRLIYGPLVKQEQREKYRKYANGSFVIGCRKLKYDGLRTHQVSEGYKLDTEIPRENSAERERERERELYSRLPQNHLFASAIFIDAHSIAKSSR